MYWRVTKLLKIAKWICRLLKGLHKASYYQSKLNVVKNRQPWQTKNSSKQKNIQ